MVITNGTFTYSERNLSDFLISMRSDKRQELLNLLLKNCYSHQHSLVCSGVFKGRRARHLPRAPLLGAPFEVLRA